MNYQTLKNYAHLHFIVIIYGFTGILGKLITLSAHYLVFYRLLLTLPILLLIIYIRRESMKVDWKTLKYYLLIGIIIGLHWLAFFHSIKVSNVSVALSCFASTSLFTGILEPIFNQKRVGKLEILCGIAVLIIIAVMLGFDIRYWQGVFFGLLGAFLAALFTVMNKQLSHTKSIVSLSFYELFGAFIPVVIMILILPLFSSQTYSNILVLPTLPDWAWLFLLASVCTAYPFAATIKLLRSLSAFNVTLAVNFEPIYTIILAFLLFGDSERMTTVFYVGLCLIIAIVFLYPVAKRNKIFSV